MTLLFDMPFERLLTYEGCNPKPADFDAVWDRALARLAAADDHVVMTLADFQVPFATCYDLRFTGTGGASIYSKLIIPKNIQKPGPAVIQFHGYTGDSGDWYDKLPYAARGFVYAALDCRGQGSGKSDDPTFVKGNTFQGQIIRGLEDDDPEKLYFFQVFLDCAQLAKVVMALPEVDPDRVGCFGGSQGGGLTLACASLVPRIKKAAPIYPFLSDYKRVWEMELAKDAYLELKDFFRHSDPTHEREEAVFTRLGYIDIQNLTPRINAEVLMHLGLMDTICPPSTQFAAYNKIRTKKSYVTYPDFGHEWLPGAMDRIYQFMSTL